MIKPKHFCDRLEALIRARFPTASVQKVGSTVVCITGGAYNGIQTKFPAPTDPIDFRNLEETANNLMDHWDEMILAKKKEKSDA